MHFLEFRLAGEVFLLLPSETKDAIKTDAVYFSDSRGLVCDTSFFGRFSERRRQTILTGSCAGSSSQF